mgnify:CR=1 FL=1
MESSSTARVLVVAYKTAATPALLDAVRARRAAGPASFTLLIPAPVSGLERAVSADHADTSEADAVLALALPLLEEASGGPVSGIIGASSPLEAIQDAVNVQGFDEIILSMLPAHVSRWLHLDLPHKLNGLGLPVTTITARG